MHPSNKISTENLATVFAYHAPRGDQAQRHGAIKSGAQAFAEIVLANAPDCADRAAAVRHIREAMMTASAAIALEP